MLYIALWIAMNPICPEERESDWNDAEETMPLKYFYNRR